MLCVKSPKRFRYADNLSEGLISAFTSELPRSSGGATGVIVVTSEGDFLDRRSCLVSKVALDLPVDVTGAG